MIKLKKEKNTDIKSLLNFTEDEAIRYEKICKDGVINSDKIILKDLSGNIKEISITETEAKQLNSEVDDNETYLKWIRNQDFGEHGDTIKKVLEKLLSITQTIGNTILRIGKVLVELFIKFINFMKENFKNTAFGILAGFILGLLLCQLPIIGWLLGGLIMPLCVVGGGILGFKADLKKKFNDPKISEQIEEVFNCTISGIGKGLKAAANGIANLAQKGTEIVTTVIASAGI
ncbi:MAG: hypothetical protein U0K92_03475 [Treponema sp.]|nr:hypothetical protein [Treponema sp.]